MYVDCNGNMNDTVRLYDSYHSLCRETICIKTIDAKIVCNALKRIIFVNFAA